MGLPLLASDLEVFFPVSLSTTKPWVITALYGALPRQATESIRELWNQPRCWSVASRYRSAGASSPGRASMTAMWEQPESIQTSSVSLPFFQVFGRPRRSHWSSSESSNQMLEPWASTISAILRTRAASRTALPSSSKKTGRGTPQVRWREMHQSGRASTVP